jgi:hypothetical protein
MLKNKVDEIKMADFGETRFQLQPQLQEDNKVNLRRNRSDTQNFS